MDEEDWVVAAAVGILVALAIFQVFLGGSRLLVSVPALLVALGISAFFSRWKHRVDYAPGGGFFGNVYENLPTPLKSGM